MNRIDASPDFSQGIEGSLFWAERLAGMRVAGKVGTNSVRLSPWISLEGIGKSKKLDFGDTAALKEFTCGGPSGGFFSSATRPMPDGRSSDRGSPTPWRSRFSGR
jgi:hypothetical protein